MSYRYTKEDWLDEDSQRWKDKLKLCTDPCHNPPSMRVFPEGEYRHVCPSCGEVTIVITNRPMCCV
jgi:hypothetical protein